MPHSLRRTLIGSGLALAMMSMPISAFAIVVSNSTTTSIKQSVRMENGQRYEETEKTIITNIDGKETTHHERHVSGGSSSSHASTSSRSASSQPSSAATVDAHFIEMMISHHEGAVRMANLARRKASHAELRDLATNIIGKQRQEIRLLKGWQRSGDRLPILERMMLRRDLKLQQRVLEKQLRGLGGNTFDKEFLHTMIQHHEHAIMMANDAKSKATKQELKDFAVHVIEDQQKEVDLMKKWLGEW
jgi:uncharacterized protein (DUF305 family)